MKPQKCFRHERVDEIPLVLGFIQQAKLAELLDRHLESHPLHQGLSSGQLVCGWLAFLFSKSSHAKVSVQNWANSHQRTLSHFFGQPLRTVEFTDDRLTLLLRRLAKASWPALEEDLWAVTCDVYQLSYEAVRLDGTSSYGYHETNPDGLLQFGHSKNHRPDLPQLKLMAAAAQPSSQLIACDVAPGNSTDDVLYLPLIKRLWRQLRRSGLLYIGDCKMAALMIRAEIVNHHDWYLMPVPNTGAHQKLIPQWIQEAINPKADVRKVWITDHAGKRKMIAEVYELTRSCGMQVGEKEVRWDERVQLVRSVELRKKRITMLEKRLRQAVEQLRRVTPAIGPGRKQVGEESLLTAKIESVLDRHKVKGLLQVTWECEKKEQYVGRGRPKSGTPPKKVESRRYVITGVMRNEAAIAEEKKKLGWRVQVTNLKKEKWPSVLCVILYNDGWCVERSFHLLKDSPLGIQPLYVREEDQIIGLTRLLLIGLRMLTLLELQVREGLEQNEEELAGLFEGQPTRVTDVPTATRVLKAIARMEITLTGETTDHGEQWHLTDLPVLLTRMLVLLRLSPDLYLGLPLLSSVHNLP